MKKLALCLACLVPLFATAQGNAPGVTAIAPADRSVPASAVDAEGAYIEYKAVISNGIVSLELGRSLKASDCIQSLERAIASPEFSAIIQKTPIVQLACVATRKKA